MASRPATQVTEEELQLLLALKDVPKGPKKGAKKERASGQKRKVKPEDDGSVEHDGATKKQQVEENTSASGGGGGNAK